MVVAMVNENKISVRHIAYMEMLLILSRCTRDYIVITQRDTTYFALVILPRKL